MTMTERFKQLSKPNRKHNIRSEASFSRTPDIIIFQNFEIGKTYETELILQNKRDVFTIFHLWKVNTYIICKYF